MKKTLTVCLLFTAAIASAQSYPLKEAYDDYLEHHYTTGTLEYTVALNRPCTWIAWGDILGSYLNMFEATGDKAYLNKFVKHAYAIQQLRLYSSGNYPYFWDMTSYGSCCTPTVYVSSHDQEVMSFHYTGRILLPMARYVYLLKNTYASLDAVPMLTGMVPASSLLTFGDMADYLQSRVEETLDQSLGHYYYSSAQGYSKTNPWTTGNTKPEINQQASWGASLLYAGYVNHLKPIYLTRGNEITAIFKNQFSVYHNSGTIDSYTWFHDRTVNPGSWLREDVSHGATDLNLALVGNELYGGTLWTSTEMNTLAHTFTYNIWDHSSNFRNNTFGMVGGNTSGSSCGYDVNSYANFFGLGEILAWMPMYQSDETAVTDGNSVYTLLRDQAWNLINQTSPRIPSGYSCPTTYLSGTQAFGGFSEVVKAQWKEECVNLTLRNRHMVYDQDFNIKNKLEIDAYSAGTITTSIVPNSFADPIINTPEFTIDNGVTANFHAGEYILVLPGFLAAPGSVVELSIDTTFCSDGLKPAGEPIVTSVKTTVVNEAGLLVYPNPSNGIFNFVSKKELVYNLELFSETGSLVTVEKSKEGKLEMNLGNSGRGLYFYKAVFETGEVIKGKLVKN